MNDRRDEQGPIEPDDEQAPGDNGNGDEESSGLTEEFDAEFDEFGADVADEFDPATPAGGEPAEGEVAEDELEEAEDEEAEEPEPEPTLPPAPWDQDAEEAEAREAEEPAEDDEYLEDEEFVAGEDAAGQGPPPRTSEWVAVDQQPGEEEPAEDAEYVEDRKFADGEEAAEQELEATAASEEPPPTEEEELPADTEPTPADAEPTPAEAKPPPTDAKPPPTDAEPVDDQPVEDEPTEVQPSVVFPAQETVEADVLALGDQEEVREQAAREGGEAAAPEQGEQAAPPPPAVPVGAAPEGEGEEEDEAPRPRIWARFLAASLIVVVSMAAATSITILLYLSDIAEGLGGLPGVKNQLAVVEPGAPETILVIGSDKRATSGNVGNGLSDTTMLLRLDPDKKAIAVLSLPRDLRVNIPGRGVAKLNEAYTLGGPKLTTRVVKQLTGLDINHVVNVNFVGFARAVNAIGCVYVDVDRHYFHSNVGLATSQQYSEINIPAGYQRLCGYQALQYVRYRHTDNDLVRAARQQDFLREARQKVPPTKLFNDRKQLIKIFTDYTTSDIENIEDVLDIFKTFLYLRNAPVRQIHFKGTLGKSYVTASQSEIKTAVRQFLGVQATPGPRAPTGPPSGGGGGGGGGAKPKPKPAPQKPAPAPAPLIDSTDSGRQFAQAADNHLHFPVYYPTKIAPGSTIDDESRPAYNIVSPDGKRKYPAYKMVITRPSPSVAIEYYGVEGTRWTDPPILDNPTDTKTIGKREYLQFYDSDRLRLVGWRTDNGSYWVSNTLGETLSAPQMMGIAQSMRPFSPGE